MAVGEVPGRVASSIRSVTLGEVEKGRGGAGGREEEREEGERKEVKRNGEGE